MNSLVNKSYLIAEAAHHEQYRKNGFLYINHPSRVAKIIEELDLSSELIAAAYLHDVPENCGVPYESLMTEMGAIVANLVFEVTTDKEVCAKVGKTAYLSSKLLVLSDDALVLKLADRLDNVSDLDGVSLEFKKKCINETINIISFLTTHRKLNEVQESLLSRIMLKLSDYEMEDECIMRLRKENPDVY